MGHLQRLLAAVFIAAASAQTPDPAKARKSNEASALQVAGLWRSGLDGRINSLAKSEGSWSMGDSRSTWTAYRDKGELVLIQEKLVSGPDGVGEQSTRSYYFINGGLLIYSADKTLRDLGAKPGPDRRVLVELVFDPKGRLVKSAKNESGKDLPVPAWEVKQARLHAKELFDLASRLAPPPGAAR